MFFITQFKEKPLLDLQIYLQTYVLNVFSVKFVVAFHFIVIRLKSILNSSNNSIQIKFTSKPADSSCYGQNGAVSNTSSLWEASSEQN